MKKSIDIVNHVLIEGGYKPTGIDISYRSDGALYATVNMVKEGFLPRTFGRVVTQEKLEEKELHEWIVSEITTMMQ